MIENNLEEEAKKLIEAEQNETLSLGKIQKHYEDDSFVKEIGWKNMPLENLPSMGLFYEKGTQISIRAANVAEIRHWSTIDENDMLGIDDMLNYIIEKCCRIKSPSRFNSYKDIKEIDRFYLLFAIRDLTFKNGENKLIMNVNDSSGNPVQVEINKDSINYYNPDERLMKYLDSSGCFNINLKSGESFKIYMPSLGVAKFIKNYAIKKRDEGKTPDKAFIKYAPFLFSNWRDISEVVFDKEILNSHSWSVQKISALDKIIDILTNSINPKIQTFTESGEEVNAPLNFQGGIKSLFLINDIFDELL